MGVPLVAADAVLYGEFILTAYAMYAADPTNLCPAVPAANDPSAMPENWEMIGWIHMSDFAFGGGSEQKFYGFVARDAAKPSSYVIALRGTEGIVEWYDDAVCFPKPFTQAPSAGDVSAGFGDIYGTMQVVSVKARPVGAGPMLAPEHRSPKSFADQIEELLRTEREPRAKDVTEHDVVVTGHSLGGALSTLYTMEHAVKKQMDPSRKVTLDRICTFASPRVGLKAFVDAFNALPIDSWRIANVQDIVPKVPPSLPLVLPYEHVNTLYAFSSAGVVRFRPNCWHSMYTYLHWLDPAGHPVEAACMVTSAQSVSPIVDEG